MPKLVTDKLRLSQINLMIGDLVSNTSPYYVFLARHVPYTDDNGASLDSAPPVVEDSVDGALYDVYRHMICAKHVTDDDVVPMVQYVEWESGTVYAQYDHRDANLDSKTWYVVVKRGTNYDLFVCLGNNNGARSTVAPSYHDSTPSESGGYETLPDYYKWKYMFTVTSAQFDKFATSGYIPVIPNAQVTGNSVHGAIDYVNVEFAGTRYDSYHSGSFLESIVGGDDEVYTIGTTAASNSNFYDGCALTITSGPGAGQVRKIVDYIVSSSTIKRVRLDVPFETIPTTASQYEITPSVLLTGDGSGFVGRALVNSASSNSIWKIEILNRGVDYTWATANVVGNTGGTTNYSTIVPMIGPYGGHGSNPASELNAKAVGISVKFDSGLSNGKVLDVNDFRTVGLLKKPMYANVVFSVGSSNDFEIGDYISQPHTGAYGYVRSVPTTTTIMITNAVGYFVTGYPVVANTTIAPQSNVSAITGQSAYVDQTTKLHITSGSLNGTFDEDEQVRQSEANGYVYSANSTYIRMTDVRGAFALADVSVPSSLTAIIGQTSQANSQIDGVVLGDFKPGSGEVLYIDNKLPVFKSVDQTETVKIILEF